VSEKDCTLFLFFFFGVEYICSFVWWGSASKVDDVTALPCRHKMADMCYYGNVTTTRWWLYVTMETLWQQQDGGYTLLFYIFNSTVI